jgi:hypothetical protein
VNSLSVTELVTGAIDTPESSEADIVNLWSRRKAFGMEFLAN